MPHEPGKPVVAFTSVKSVPPLLRTAATRQPRSCSATVTSATKLESRTKQALRGGLDYTLSTSTTLQPLTGKKVVLHRRCGGKCPPPNEMAITRKWASMSFISFTKWLSPLVALIAWLYRLFTGLDKQLPLTTLAQMVFCAVHYLV